MPQTSPLTWTTMLMTTTILIYQMNSNIKFEQKIMKKKKEKMMKKKKKIKI